MMRYPGFIGPSYTSQAPMADCATLVNWLIEVMEDPGAKSRAIFLPTPGFEQFASVGQTTGTAIFSTSAQNGRCFTVIGARLYEVHEDGTTTERGTVAQDQNPATICTNGDGGNQLFITSGGNGYNYDLITNTLTQIAALNGKATMGGFLDGFFLAFDKTTGTVYLSDLYDGTVWDPTQFFSRSSRADTWQAMWITAQGQIFLPGTKTRDYWYDAGTFPIPFAPSQAGTQPDGIAATFSMSENSGTLAWLQTNEDGGFKVFAASGYRGERISTHALEFAISSYLFPEEAIGESYTDQGHRFYLLTFPRDQKTWCYDFDTKAWHERSTRSAAGVDEAWRVRFHCFAFNKHLWVDSGSGKIWRSDVSFPTDVDGLVIRRERTAPSICAMHERLNFGRFELLMQTGIGNTNAPGQFPRVIKQSSNDGGQTFGSERAASAGQQGQKWVRVKWERNGSSRDRSERVVVSDPVIPWAIIDAFYDVRDPRGAAIGRSA